MYVSSCAFVPYSDSGYVYLFQNKDRPEGKPPNFRQYLEAVLAFNKHHSVVSLVVLVYINSIKVF